MSIQFGIWNWEGKQPNTNYIEKVSAVLAPYGPDNSGEYSNGGTKILFRAFHTTKESRCEVQPHASRSGFVLTWDGRLDNRAQMINELQGCLTITSSDIAVVAAAYERWGNSCFGKFIGDWALSIWNPSNRSLLLAKDPLGTRHLYYFIEHDQVKWSTILDPLVLFAGKTFTICEEYIAGWFAILFPAAHLTPYEGIYAVPASSYIVVRPGVRSISKYWDFDSSKTIRYRTDAEYEEHFRSVFAEAVRRRLRSDNPVLAELSGGIDSSAIVCVADAVLSREVSETPRLDTVSWYDDSNPNWGERPYVEMVEEKRGRAGYHIDFGAKEQRELTDSPEAFETQRPLSEFETDRFEATPVSSCLAIPFRQYEAYIKSQGYRVTLSGIGGEEATGGFTPTPKPELQDLLARAHFVALVQRLNTWAMKMKKPRLPLLWEAARDFLFSSAAGVPRNMHPSRWFDSDFVRRNHTALCCYPTRMNVFGALPSFQHHLHELDHVRRFLAFVRPHSDRLREQRYPYLDRSLLEFAYAIPREQLVRVGQRRSLMRRALARIVPQQLLNKRKLATLASEPNDDAHSVWLASSAIGQHLISSSVGIVNPEQLREELQKAGRNKDVPIRSLLLTLKLESWLRHLVAQGVLTSPTESKTAIDPTHFDSKRQAAVC